MPDKAIIERRKTGRQMRRSRNQLFPFRGWQPCWGFPEIQSTAFSATRDISTFLKSLWWLAGKELQRRALPLSSKGKIITDCAQTQMTNLLMSDLLVTDPLVTGLQEINFPGKGTKWLSRMKRVQTRIFHVGIGRTHSCLLYFLTWRICNSLAEAASRAFMSRQAISRYAEKGCFKFCRVGRKVRISRDGFERWLASRQEELMKY